MSVSCYSERKRQELKAKRKRKRKELKSKREELLRVAEQRGRQGCGKRDMPRSPSIDRATTN